MPIRIRSFFVGLLEKIGPGGVYFKYARGIAFGLGTILLILVGVYLFPTIKSWFVKPAPPISSPKAVNCDHSKATRLPKGSQSWAFSFGDGVTGPKIQTATIDTLTPRAGSTQNLTLTIKNQSPLTTARAFVYTDDRSQQYDLKLTKGSATDGTWSGLWRLDDTTDCTYHIDFDLRSPTGDWTGGLTFR